MSSISDFAQGNANPSSPLSVADTGGPSEVHGSSITPTDDVTAATTVSATPSRRNTLSKRNSVRRASSLKRSKSSRSLKAGSLAGFGGVDTNQEYNSAFSTPIPTQGSPTDILANRFQAWRQLLKSLIAYFREIQNSYEARAKAANKVENAMATVMTPAMFKDHHGLRDATRILADYHKRSIAEARKSYEIENDVIGALTGLRSDLGQKIKEIKSLSGDFKNSVEKEKDNTRREVEKYQEALQQADRDEGAMGKNDPFVVRLGVDRAIEKQIDEENYLHRAYLNLESSGRELESIVVGEIQKAYNALAGILKREGDDAYNAVESLRSGPISMPKDAEWMSFVQNDDHFVDPGLPLRRIEDIEYPGKHHPAAAEVRAGMLERKTKYLKSYTAGWYVLSPTHLHEFKSADKIYTQPPVMSLYLPDQKVGSHSEVGSSSNKFLVKGKQSGGVHKGHNWVFRAESHDTMLAWYEDMRTLTEKTGEDRNAFVRKHARTYSSSSRRQSFSTDGMEDDEADKVPYSADAHSLASGAQAQDAIPQRPQPGGRFPSDLRVPLARNVSKVQSSASSEPPEPETKDFAMSGGLSSSTNELDEEHARDERDPYRLDGVTAGPSTVSTDTGVSEVEESYFGPAPPAENKEVESAQRQGRSAFDPGLQHQPGIHSQTEAVSVAGPGGTLTSTEANKNVEQGLAPVHHPVLTPDVPEKSERRSSPPTVHDHDSTPSAAQIAAVDAWQEPGSSEEPRATSNAARQDQRISVSQLHVPGEYPKQI